MPPDAALRHRGGPAAHDCTATAPDAARVAALDAYFTAMMDSGLSASSFTARVVASTRASLAAAALGAWCAFTGALHGGAPGPTLDAARCGWRRPTTSMRGWNANWRPASG